MTNQQKKKSIFFFLFNMFVWSLVVSMSVSGFHLCQKKPTGQHPETEPATRPQPGPPESSE